MEDEEGFILSVAEFMLHSYIAKEMNRVIVFIIKLDNLPLNFVTQGCGRSAVIVNPRHTRRKSLTYMTILIL